MKDDALLPDLRSCVPRDDVGCKFDGTLTSLGVVNVIFRTATIGPGANRNRALARKRGEV
jgi:hypothetical protein